MTNYDQSGLKNTIQQFSMLGSNIKLIMNVSGTAQVDLRAGAGVVLQNALKQSMAGLYPVMKCEMHSWPVKTCKKYNWHYFIKTVHNVNVA